jgi:riboflavin kinase/FMN adenylyltransferase
MIDGLENRINLIKNAGIDIVIVLNFTEQLRRLDAYSFVKMLKENLKIRYLLGGPDFALGKNREGSIDQLKKYGEEFNFTIEVVPPFIFEGVAVRSSLIRKTIAAGEIARSSRLLGYTYSLSGPIVSGDRRGRELGFPTVNLEVNPDLVIPGDGVYATIARIDGKALPAVTNIGIRPTFDSTKRLIETHILDFNLVLKEQNVTIEFIERLREEKRFNSAAELITQINKDIEQAKSILKGI